MFLYHDARRPIVTLTDPQSAASMTVNLIEIGRFETGWLLEHPVQPYGPIAVVRTDVLGPQSK
jgi:hypothetical protein